MNTPKDIYLDGKDPAEVMNQYLCVYCGGEGKVEPGQGRGVPHPAFEDKEECPRCRGAGWDPAKSCTKKFSTDFRGRNIV